MNEETVQINGSHDTNVPADQENLQRDYRKTRTLNEKRELHKKIFATRNSVLTDLYQNSNIRTVYNIFIVITIYLILINLLYEWRDHQVISFGLVELAQKFKNIEIALLAWLLIMFITMLTIPVFRRWSRIYRRTNFKKSISAVFIILYLVYIIGIQAISTYVCLQYDLSVVSCFAILMETLRVGMKNYAYIRSNAERVTRPEPYNSPRFRHFMYFMWCPTMLYRDTYPRNSKRSWKRVFRYVVEFLTAVYCMSLLNNNFIQKSFVDYGKAEVTLLSLFIRWIELTVIATPLFYFYTFYMLLHAWLNIFAELLQFDDRVFYKDWWNAKSFREFYRWWNVIVHEFLYEYLYTDLYNHITRKSALLSSLLTIFISAVVHEYVLAVATRFFLPVLLLVYLIFGISYMYIEMDTRVGNVFVWFNLVIGMSLFVLLYLMEFYARINCGVERTENTTLSYYYTPMILACNNIVLV